MNESELAREMIAARELPADSEHLAHLEGMYSAIRAGVIALDELVGNGDVTPSSRFTADFPVTS